MIRLTRRADDPHALLLQAAQGPRQIGDGHERDDIRAPAGDLAHGRIQARRPVGGRDDRMDAHRRRAAQTRAQIVRILDTIEHQQESRLLQRIEHIIERDMARRAGHARDDTLMPHAAGHAFEPFGIDRNDLDLLQLGVTHEIARAGIVPVRIDEDLEDGIRLVAKFGNDGVEAVDEADL